MSTYIDTAYNKVYGISIFTIFIEVSIFIEFAFCAYLHG